LNDAERLRDVTGYGLVDRSALFRSVEHCVTLWAEEAIQDKRHHFYEIPMPDDFWLPGKRARELTVALAYCPPVRTTRIDYRASVTGFKLIQSESLEKVLQSFNRAFDREVAPTIDERSTGSRFAETLRSKGTVQASTWTFNQPSKAMRQSRWFVMVTRNDSPSGATLTAERESYALVANLADRSCARPRLFTRIGARLRARARARMRS